MELSATEREVVVDFDVQVKLAVYRRFADTGQRPVPEDIAGPIGSDAKAVLDAYKRLGRQRLLVLEDDGMSIRMASPFSGVPTQHLVQSGGVRYFANCAWDALGIVAALQRRGFVHSRCERSGEPLNLEVGVSGPEPSSWLFHCLVPTAQWWDDIVFT